MSDIVEDNGSSAGNEAPPGGVEGAPPPPGTSSSPPVTPSRREKQKIGPRDVELVGGYRVVGEEVARPVVRALRARGVTEEYVAKKLHGLVSRSYRRAMGEEGTAGDVGTALMALKLLAKVRGDMPSAGAVSGGGVAALPSQLVVQVVNVLREVEREGGVVDVTPTRIAE